MTLSETTAEHPRGGAEIARLGGWTGWTIHELNQESAGPETGEERYTVFHPSEVELGETTKRILEEDGARSSPRGW